MIDRKKLLVAADTFKDGAVGFQINNNKPERPTQGGNSKKV